MAGQLTFSLLLVAGSLLGAVNHIDPWGVLLALGVANFFGYMAGAIYDRWEAK